MGLGHSPSIVTSNLVMCLDAANYKSFKGVPATNLLYALFDTNGTVNTTDFKTSYGTEVDFIPSLGYRTVRYCNIYNNYPTSGNCCPRLFDYGGNAFSKNITVSPSTTYTYEIIYKVSSGYTSANYMYRYEYNGGTYVTESGVHSNSNRTSLGDGWYHAWGQFTTAATTNNLWATGMWYYQYGVYDKVSVAGASLHQGTYIIPPEHMLAAQENRGATVATGGGWADVIGNGNNGTLTNGPTYNSSNGGSIVFDGTNDRIDCGTNFSSVITGTNSFSIECWVYPQNTQATYADIWGNHTDNVTGIVCQQNASTLNQYSWGWGNGISWGTSGASNMFNLSTLQWNHFVAIRSGTSILTYLNGNLIDTSTNSSPVAPNSSFNFQIGTGYNLGSSRCFNGNISNFRIYNKALTAAEVQQNFNALRGRYGI